MESNLNFGYMSYSRANPDFNVNYPNLPGININGGEDQSKIRQSWDFPTRQDMDFNSPNISYPISPTYNPDFGSKNFNEHNPSSPADTPGSGTSSDSNSDLIFPYYFVVENREVKDLIGSHKLYEIQSILSKEEKKIKCYRRYNQFHKLNAKLLRKYPYLLIPRLTPKNPYVKFLGAEDNFYENRRRQLNIYLNFLAQNSLSKTMEFDKFINELDFDDTFFSSDDGKTFPESVKLTDTYKNRILGVFYGLFGGKEEKSFYENENRLSEMEINYKRIVEKYKLIKDDMLAYLKTLKINEKGFKQLSDTCCYMKDTLDSITNSENNFNLFSQICLNASKVNESHHLLTGIELANKLEGFISLQLGVCDLFDRYNEYMKSYKNVLKAYEHARDNNFNNLDAFSKELEESKTLKTVFEESLMEEIKDFSRLNNKFTDFIEEFKNLIKSINYQVGEVSSRIAKEII